MTYPKCKKDKLVDLYLDGYSATEAARVVGCSYIVCYNELRKRGISVRSISEANKLLGGLTESDRVKIVELYNSGKTSTEISKVFGVSISVVLAEINHRTTTRSPDIYNRKNNINDNYFNQIDTADKAYWLGFLAADGSVNRYRNTISIGLKASDRGHLEKLKESIKTSKSVKIYQNSAHLAFSSKMIKESLAKYGVIPNKSLVLRPPNLFYFERDFWRGCVDGDGGIYIYKDGKPSIYLCGTKYMIQGFIDFIDKNIPNVRKRTSNNCKGEVLKQTCYSGSVGKNVIKLLYNNANYYLDRKMELARRVI